MEEKERYPKDCIHQYDDGWHITFKAQGGNIVRFAHPYKTKAMAEIYRVILNNERK